MPLHEKPGNVVVILRAQSEAFVVGRYHGPAAFTQHNL